MTGTLMLLSCLVLPISDEAVSVKDKNGSVAVKDKSKPVREALEAQYAKLAAAIENKDHVAFQALRTADFHTVDEHGRKHTPEEMSERARAMLESLQPPIETTNTIGTIDVQGADARATVRQYFSKMLQVAGKLRKIETYVTQDETWTKTPDGWKLRFVDGVRDGEYYVDGKRIDPSKPYDPDAPPFDPQVQR
jgi:hypothetical protein